MCTALTFGDQDLYFGRTLDHTGSYGEAVIVTPRRFPLPFRHLEAVEDHYAIIGIGCVRDGFPLYYDGINEKGLAMAGLNFVESACYGKPQPDRENVAQFELLPWILAACATVEEAKLRLQSVCVTDTAFSAEIPPAKLHWLIADSAEAAVLEVMADGVHLHPNPVGVLTNEPPFPLQMFSLNNYMHLSAHMPKNRFSDRLPLKAYSKGMGALGLPGDLSSQSRFARAAFFKCNAEPGETGAEKLEQFFHLLDTVKMPRGCCRAEDGTAEYTLYQCCYHGSACYYTTYETRQIRAVELRQEALDGDGLLSYPLEREE